MGSVRICEFLSGGQHKPFFCSTQFRFHQACSLLVLTNAAEPVGVSLTAPACLADLLRCLTTW